MARDHLTACNQSALLRALALGWRAYVFDERQREARFLRANIESRQEWERRVVATGLLPGPGGSVERAEWMVYFPPAAEVMERLGEVDRADEIRRAAEIPEVSHDLLSILCEPIRQVLWPHDDGTLPRMPEPTDDLREWVRQWQRTDREVTRLFERATRRVQSASCRVAVQSVAPKNLATRAGDTGPHASADALVAAPATPGEGIAPKHLGGPPFLGVPEPVPCPVGPPEAEAGAVEKRPAAPAEPKPPRPAGGWTTPLAITKLTEYFQNDWHTMRGILGDWEKRGQAEKVRGKWRIGLNQLPEGVRAKLYPATPAAPPSKPIQPAQGWSEPQGIFAWVKSLGMGRSETEEFLTALRDKGQAKQDSSTGLWMIKRECLPEKPKAKPDAKR